MTSFVDLDVGRPGWLLGLIPGRSGAAVQAWLAAQPQPWREGIEVVALDPSAPFAAAIRRLLPQAVIVVDHWHLIRLANQAVTEVRQRVAREQLGRRGRRADPAWAHRRLLLTAGDRLSRRGLARLRHVLAVDDPSNEIWPPGRRNRHRPLTAQYSAPVRGADAMAGLRFTPPARQRLRSPRQLAAPLAGCSDRGAAVYVSSRPQRQKRMSWPIACRAVPSSTRPAQS